MNLNEYARDIFAPKKKQTVNDWCEQEVTLPIGPFAGSKYRARVTPYLPFILEQVANPKVKKVVLKMGTQLGKSTTLHLALLWAIKHEPSTALYVTAIEKDSKSVSKNIIQPIIESSDELRALKPANLKEEYQNLEQKFINGALVWFVGAQSSNALSSKPVRLLLADEIRSYKTETGGNEADPLNLALNRVKSYANHKIILASSPTVANVGISKHHAEGSCHEYRVSCPHCDGPKFKLDFDGLKWSSEAKKDKKWNKKEVKASVYYQCPNCKGQITEAHKTKILRSGQWVQTNFEALEDHLSFHLSSLYSLAISWADIVLKFLESKDSIGGLKDFKQNYLAEDWQEATEAVTDLTDLEILKKPYSKGDLQTGRVLMGIDCQSQTLKYVVRQFNGEESYLIDYGEVVTFDTIREIEKKFGADAVIVDTGHRTAEVYEEIFKSRSWYGIKGWNQSKMPEPFKIVNFDPFTGTREQGRYKIKLVHCNDPIWKAELVKCLRGEKEWFIPEYIGEDYLQELVNEIPVEIEKRDGTKVISWRVLGKQDWFDADKYLLVLNHILTGKPKSELNKPGQQRQRFTGFSIS